MSWLVQSLIYASKGMAKIFLLVLVFKNYGIIPQFLKLAITLLCRGNIVSFCNYPKGLEWNLNNFMTWIFWGKLAQRGES